MTAQGAGVGHWEGMAVFTPLNSPGGPGPGAGGQGGEKLRLWQAGGAALPPLRTGWSRTAPASPSAAACCYRHIRYEAELKIKEARVRDALERIGGFSGLPMRPILGAPSRDGYRNKALLPLGVKKGRQFVHGLLRGELPTALWTASGACCSRRNSTGPWRLSGSGRRHTATRCTTRGATPAKCGGCTCAMGGTVRPGAGLRGGQRQRAPSRAGIGGAAQGGGAGPCQRGDQLQPGAHQRGPGQKVPHHLRDGHHRGQVVRAAVPALPPSPSTR